MISDPVSYLKLEAKENIRRHIISMISFVYYGQSKQSIHIIWTLLLLATIATLGQISNVGFKLGPISSKIPTEPLELLQLMY